MQKIQWVLKSLILALGLFSTSAFADKEVRVPILTYHDFSTTRSGSMTINTEKFEEQLKWIKDNGYTVIPLRQLADYLQGKTSSIPDKSVVITADDGRKSVYTDMLPLVRKYNIPVTLFIYPTSISNASYAMTWGELKDLQKTGHFDVQGHTYWHPNFKQERKRLSASEYDKLVHANFVSAKKFIDKKLGTDITILAWPYGIYDDNLKQGAAKAGYEMALSIDARPASKAEHMMSQPRYLIVQSQSMKTFAAIVSGNMPGKKTKE